MSIAVATKTSIARTSRPRCSETDMATSVRVEGRCFLPLLGTRSRVQTAHARLLPVCRARMVGSRNLTTAETSEAMASSSSEVTVLLRLWSAGDERAREQLIPLMYGALRELAHRRRGGAPVESSLDTTELVHEAYLRLVGARHVDLPDRAKFLALASEVMRNLLVDRAVSYTHLTLPTR